MNDSSFDVGIRVGPLTDSSLVAKPLGFAHWVLVATPTYLVYPSRRHLSPTARSFIDHLASAAGLPLEDLSTKPAAD